jgi:diguanylate cyclase (GGDEF)-like protein/PAS domain S-box-containing protein
VHGSGQFNLHAPDADEPTMKRPWIAPVLAVVLTAGLVGAYLALDGARNAEWLRVAAPGLAALSVFVAALRSRPVRPVPWWVFGAGLGVLAAATITQADAMLRGDTTFPGDAEALMVLGYPALFAGMAGLTSSRRNCRDLLAGSEPVIYSIAVTALVWVAVTGPHLDDEGFPLRPEAWVWVFPLLDGLLATIALRRIGGNESSRFEMLSLGCLLLGAGHAISAWAALDGRLEPGDWQATAPIFGFMMIGGAFLLATRVTRADSAPRVHWTQIFGLLFASLVPLGALLLMLATGLASRSSSVVVSGATILVIVLALARMWRLVDQVRTLSEQRGRDRLAAMVEHSSDVVMLADAAGLVNYASPGLRAMLGYDPESWSGRQLTDLVVAGERDGARRQVQRVVDHGPGGTVEFEATLAHLDGQQRKATVVIANLVGGAAVDGIVATIRDVTEQRNLERQLSHRAFHDELTGLANRALFLDRMDHALRIARSEADPVVVLFVDLDDFKAVNDGLGHAVGDQVLKAVADKIRRAAGTGDTAARLGGDEFALLLEDRGGIDRAVDVAERLLDALHEPLRVANEDIVVLASVGVAIAAPGTSTTSLLRDADIAMYEAKRAGKGQIRIFDPAMRMVATKHLEYRGDLAQAIDRGQMRLVFMPYVDLSTGQVVGAEALVRWQHPEHGDVPATEFLPIAERSGLVVPMGYWVLEQAAEQASRWRAGLLLSLNVSEVQLRQPDFADRVVTIIDGHHLDPSMVVFELNESTLADEGGRATGAIARLRAVGFRFAIDDFGTGQCSLASLQRQPIDLLKIDRTAVHAFGDDPHGPSLARTILQTATSIGVLTVAEGIETAGQLRELRRLGCDLGQGYLLSHPVEVNEIERRFGHPDVVVAP